MARWKIKNILEAGGRA